MLTGKHILLVEDDLGLRATLREQLHAEGCEVEEAGNGLEALVCLQDKSFDAVVTDLVMPDMEGIGLLLEMKQRGIEIPVLVISGGGAGRSGLSYLEAALKLGADKAMAKPFGHREFIDGIMAILIA